MNKEPQILQQPTFRRAATLTAALALFAVVVRLGSLGYKSLWLDEAASLRFATAFTPQVLWQDFPDRLHPPFYYWLLHQTVDILGQQEWQLRLPSALSGIVNFGLFYLLARRLSFRNRWVPIIGLTLLSLSPLEFWYTQEARMYAATTMLGLLLALGLALNHPAGSILVLISLGVGLLTSYLFVPLWIGLLALWLVYWWYQGRPLIPFLTHLLAMAGAWCLFLPYRMHLASVLSRLNHVLLFDNIRTVLGVPELPAAAYLLLLALIGLGMVLVAALLRALLLRPAWRRWLAPLFLSGLVIATLFMAVPRLYTLKRVLVVGWPYLLLLAAWFLGQKLATGRRRAGYAWWGILLTVSLVATSVTLLTPKDDWRGVGSYLESSMPQDVALWIDPFWNVWPLAYYQADVADMTVSRSRTDRIETVATEHNHIWLVAERYGPSPPTSPSERWLDANWQLVKTVPFARLEIRQYRAADDS